MSRKERLAQSELRVDTVRTEELQAVLAKFSELFKSCAGPQGKTHVIRNACGGHMTLTGCCSRLLGAMMLTRPELKLLASSVEAHLQQHNDSGLFLMTMCSHLILASAKSDINPSTVASLYATFLDITTSFLNDPECQVCVKTDFSDLNVLLQYVRSVLLSKSLLSLSPANCDHLCRLTLKAFLQSIPSDNVDPVNHVSDGIFHLTLEGSLLSESKLVPGLLLRYPELSTVQGLRDLSVHHSTMPPGDLHEGMGVDKCVRVALFTCSLSGDFEEVPDCHFELSLEQSTAVEREAVNTLLGLCQSLADCGVGLLLCQRVIHPTVKSALRARGILFLDRLGSQVIPYVQHLTGASPLSTAIDPTAVQSSVGWVSTVEHQILSGKSYLWLTRPQPCLVSTMVLCAPWEERLLELKVCVVAALKGLYQLAQTKTLLAGGGCWQVHCAQALQEKVLSEAISLAKDHHCNESVVLQALSLFRGSLLAWAHNLASHTQESLLADPLQGHLWRVPRQWETALPLSAPLSCCCSMKSVAGDAVRMFSFLSKCEAQPYAMRLSDKLSQTPVISENVGERILDCFSSSVDALRQAVTTACLILSISQFISDRN